MILQITGGILLIVVVIAAAWHFTDIRKTKLLTESRERMQRAENDQRTFENNAIRMYENERQKLHEAQVRIGILEHQLARAREQMSKVKIGK